MDRRKTKRGADAVACLPDDDSLVEILSRLPAKPLFRFKCVSKAWRDLIADRLRCRKFPQTLEGFFPRGGIVQNFGAFIDLSGRPVPLVDPSFSFLTKLPEIGKIVLLDSCNGLLLFGRRHRVSDDIFNSLGFIVCNPATEQWVFVPRSGWTPWDGDSIDEEDQDYVIIENVPITRLIFDPAVSPHFQLVQLCSDGGLGVHTFSSVTGAWGRLERVQSLTWIRTSVVCPFNGMLHVSTNYFDNQYNRIVAVGVQGRPSRTIHLPPNCGRLVFVGQSQGRLHCLSGCMEKGSPMTELSIWVLEDYNAGKWVLRDNVSFSQLFGRTSGLWRSDWNVFAIHPDRSLVFFVQYWNRKMISYDMDTKEVHGLYTLGHDHQFVTPYVPYFAESAMLTKKH